MGVFYNVERPIGTQMMLFRYTILGVRRFSNSIVRLKTQQETTLVYNLLNYKSSFPQDSIINSNITQLCQLLKHKQDTSTLRIGILYENHHTQSNSKIIECLLADPFSESNAKWFKEIISRNKNSTTQFTYGVEADRTANTYKIPSPILSGLYRSSFKETPKETEFPNDIIIDEIIDHSSIDIFNYTFLINIKNQISTQDYPTEIQNKILLNVIDNKEYTPSSTENSPVTFKNQSHSHIIKLNSTLAYDGITDFIENDVAASSRYFDHMRNSNLYELLKAITWFSRSDIIGSWLLNNIQSNIEEKTHSALTPAKVNLVVKTDISKFVDSVNRELQYEFEPKTEKFFHSRLNWWKLYYKNDNVSYDIKDFFNLNFMNKSIEQFNFIKGKITTNDNEINNPLLALKTEVINKRVEQEVQPVVYKALGTAFVYYQLPISILSFVAYQHFDFTVNAAIALLGLGWVVGFNHVSKVWTGFSNEWLNKLFEEVRLCLGKDCIDEGLLKQSNEKLVHDTKLSNLRLDILEKVRKSNISFNK
ncbi:uncharacterized protein J8A68_001770 [[Candida] subhashii]|uniref:Mmc1 C-terminal domain-containing protein n=1 Tax=[Candida] subhashii TaxID=561895 RepID=A0A8J5QNC8_9ASCO|nr:uncharacterized protein J8A68_001770 [[Candida] subhashii]KAG7664674.1 hypothetical protein J8A68_001770 [[Candida] subhashii]